MGQCGTLPLIFKSHINVLIYYEWRIPNLFGWNKCNIFTLLFNENKTTPGFFTHKCSRPYKIFASLASLSCASIECNDIQQQCQLSQALHLTYTQSTNFLTNSIWLYDLQVFTLFIKSNVINTLKKISPWIRVFHAWNVWFYKSLCKSNWLKIQYFGRSSNIFAKHFCKCFTKISTTQENKLANIKCLLVENQ